MAVIFRFHWWQRLVIYGIWIAGLILADAAPLGQARSSLDRGMPVGQQVVLSTVACLALLTCAVVFTWIRLRHSSKVAERAAPV
jgi:hypothetical protein